MSSTESAAIRKKKYEFNRISTCSNVILNILFVLITIICLAPLLLLAIISFSDASSVTKYGYSFFPHAWSLAAYAFILKSASTIFSAYGISIFVTVVGTLTSMLIIALYAYPLSRSNFRYKNVFSFIVFFTMIFGGGLVPWVMVYTHVLPIKDTLIVLILPYLITGWNVIIMRTFMKSTIPEEVLESARIDGAGEFRTFFVIVLPLCKAGLATIGLFVMLNYWNDWYLPLIFISDTKLYNIQYFLYQMLISIQFLTSAQGHGAEAIKNIPAETARMAIAVLAIGPIIFAYPFFQQYFIKGLTIGAVKG
jgi:putative aldouronate transport system permease protein